LYGGVSFLFRFPFYFYFLFSKQKNKTKREKNGKQSKHFNEGKKGRDKIFTDTEKVLSQLVVIFCLFFLFFFLLGFFF